MSTPQVSNEEINAAAIHAAAAAAKALGRRMETSTKQRYESRNVISSIIPGYTAPLSLDSSALDVFRKSGKKISDVKISAMNMHAHQTNCNSADQVTNFKTGGKRLQLKSSAGKGWFDMAPTPLTSQLAADIAVIRNRQYLDPKRFYKSSDFKVGANKGTDKLLQVGTVIEGPSEYFSSRLGKRERRSNFTDEMMRENIGISYVHKRYNALQRERTSRGKMRKTFGKRLKKSK